MKYIESIRQGIEQSIIRHNTVVLGEDIGEPYGGAFKVTKGLSNKYPDNIIMTPMSEQGFTGVGIGSALCGGYIIVEIMFGDFITLCADQLINHAAKLYDVYGSTLHFVLRTPSGGYRGYGATHSQSLERLFCGIPGLSVIAPSIFHNPGNMLLNAIETGKPTLFAENKLDYNRALIDSESIIEYFEINTYNDILHISIKGESPEATLITYGSMSFTAYEIAQDLMLNEEIPVQILVIHDLNSDADKIQNSIKSDTIIFLEEGWKKYGIGTEFLSCCNNRKTAKVGAALSSILSGKRLEHSILPSKAGIIDMIKGLLP